MKRILLATDLSDNARLALKRAVQLAARTEASLDILHAGASEAVRTGLLAEARSIAGPAGAGLDIKVHLSTRRPEEAILQQAERCGADLIVLGGHGAPRLRDAIFGTVATHVARHSPVPVLIVQSDPALPWLELMVAADRPEAAPGLVEAALEIAPKAEVFAVHALDSGFGGTEREAAAFEEVLARATAGRPDARVTAHRHAIVDRGEPLRVLMDETERLVPDLVVMGTRRRATYLGSHAVDAVFWCPADLLIVPEPAPVPAEA